MKEGSECNGETLTGNHGSVHGRGGQCSPHWLV